MSLILNTQKKRDFNIRPKSQWMNGIYLSGKQWGLVCLTSYVVLMLGLYETWLALRSSLMVSAGMDFEKPSPLQVLVGVRTSVTTGFFSIAVCVMMWSDEHIYRNNIQCFQKDILCLQARLNEVLHTTSANHRVLTFSCQQLFLFIIKCLKTEDFFF